VFPLVELAVAAVVGADCWPGCGGWYDFARWYSGFTHKTEPAALPA